MSPSASEPLLRHQGAGSRWGELAAYAMRRAAKELVGVNILLAFAPLGFVAGTWQWSAVLVSVFNFLPIIPLSAIISDASDNLASRWGPLIGGLINATFGNAVELIVRHAPSSDRGRAWSVPPPVMLLMFASWKC